ncbi:MAG: molybdenum cofactor guanylyltransferase [Deferrisomatales bacterium]|nr:molybdenum cofactor guanylyltransferase [Deferrisomatales bacterium]
MGGARPLLGSPLTAILAGGKSRRMGADKVALPLGGVPLIERVWSRVALFSTRIVVVGGAPRLDRLAVPTWPDLYPGAGALGGVATAVAGAKQAGEEAVLCVACDMPLLEPALLRHLWQASPGWDVVVPRVAEGYEPLCAVYRPSVLPFLEEEIARGNLRILDVYGKVRTLEVREPELRRHDPELRSFLNVNQPADLEQAARLLAGKAQGAPEARSSG